jgi:hypothetical protein
LCFGSLLAVSQGLRSWLAWQAGPASPRAFALRAFLTARVCGSSLDPLALWPFPSSTRAAFAWYSMARGSTSRSCSLSKSGARLCFFRGLLSSLVLWSRPSRDPPPSCGSAVNGQVSSSTVSLLNSPAKPTKIIYCPKLQVRPNPSLERTSTSLAREPTQVIVPSRGPTWFRPAQLKR